MQAYHLSKYLASKPVGFCSKAVEVLHNKWKHVIANNNEIITEENPIVL